MKTILAFFFVFLSTLGQSKAATCTLHSPNFDIEIDNKENSKQANNEIIVYYFHATRRCETCQAVEKISKETITNYNSSSIKFRSINREEDANQTLIQKYKIAGQTLLIVKGEKVVDLTNTAFLNARTKPDKLKAKIRETVDNLSK